MSSMRNATARRNHKERAQPTGRARFGLLEKHKDYSLRAADHNLKKRKIKSLQQKASERNQDEFYFGMMNSESAGGIKRSKRGEENNGGGKVLGQAVVKLMKTQDEGYLRTQLQTIKKKRERMEEDVVAGDVGVKASGLGKKIVFGEDGEDPVAVPSQDHDMDDFDMDSNASGDTASELEGAETAGMTKAQISAVRRRRHALVSKRRQLEALRNTEKEIGLALHEVEAQRARMGGKSGGVNKYGVAFKARQRTG
ncbi:hypothetical protein LTS10_008933 [Elasticomyces elasticus]|nr:hypothetical protein LTS10_008933 [Elasticomyces elasticus]